MEAAGNKKKCEQSTFIIQHLQRGNKLNQQMYKMYVRKKWDESFQMSKLDRLL